MRVRLSPTGSPLTLPLAARRHLRTAVPVGLAALLASGCSLGASEFNGNRPDPSASQEQVVRTPSPVGTDLPYTDPPVRQPLPGPSGGLPGQPPTSVPEASPGETQDGGGAPGN